GPLAPAVYWRRRVLVLAGLLVVVLAIAYACRGATASSAEGQRPTAVTTGTTPPPLPTSEPPSISLSPSPSLVPTTPPRSASPTPESRPGAPARLGGVRRLGPDRHRHDRVPLRDRDPPPVRRHLRAPPRGHELVEAHVHPGRRLDPRGADHQARLDEDLVLRR